MTRSSFLMLLASQPARPEVKVILDQSVTLDEGNLAKLRGYVWTSEEKSYKKGQVTREQQFEINLVSGALYWRKLNVTGAELQAEQTRLAQHLANPGKAYDWRNERRYLELLAETHDAKYLGEEVIAGRRNHVIATQPKPGVQARILGSFRYKLWIDAAELHWTRAEVEVVRNVSWLFHQLAIGRLSYPYSNNIVNTGDLRKGARTTTELQRLPDGVWTLAKHRTESGNFSNELRYFNYRKFASESQLITGPETP
jgi:hypothetical protein